MANTGSPEYPWIVVPEDHPAFKDEAAAIRYVKRVWVGQSEAQRDRHILAKIEEFLDPDYDVKVIKTHIDEGEDGGEE